MLHILSTDRHEAEPGLFRAMFEARKRVFVDLLGWNVPVLADRFEVDQFDDQYATYLILTDADGEHLASARLLPTTRPHILGSFFPELCAGHVPQGKDIVEITRFCLDRRLKAPARRTARNTLVQAIAAHGVASGIGLYTGVAEASWLQQILEFGWHARALGPLQRLGGSLLGAIAIDINSETLTLLAGLDAQEPVRLHDVEVRYAA